MNLVATHIASLTGLHLPPPLALFLTLAFIVFLFRRDIRERPNVSSALWLPLLWLVFTCSRPVTTWLHIFGLPVGGGVSNEEGSPVDACFVYAMATAGLFVLIERQVSLSEVLQRNGWLVAFIAYCFISVSWSDDPFISFRRATKIFGHPIMALIVLTEPDFEEALTRLMKRCAYVVVPVSILFIKYYPQLGVSYDEWSGATNPGHLRRQKRAGCRLSDPRLLFLLAFAANLANRTEHSATKRASIDRRVLNRYLVPFKTVAQCHSCHMSISSDTDSCVCRHPSYN